MFIFFLFSNQVTEVSRTFSLTIFLRQEYVNFFLIDFNVNERSLHSRHPFLAIIHVVSFRAKIVIAIAEFWWTRGLKFRGHKTLGRIRLPFL